MNRLSTKLLSLLVLLCTAVTAWGQTDAQWDIKYYAYRNGEYEAIVKGFTAGTTLSGAVTIPEKLTRSGKDYYIVGLDVAAFQGQKGVTSVTFPNNANHPFVMISNNAFQNCTGLTSIELPTTLTTLGNSAFAGCTNLAGKVTLPESLGTNLEPYVFDGCANLTEVNTDQFTYIGNAAFRNCTSLKKAWTTSVIRTDVAGIIGAEAFSGCSALTGTLDLTGATSIGGLAFSKCAKLTGALDLSGSAFPLTYMGGNAFDNCVGLTSLKLSPYMNYVPTSCFIGCTGMRGNLTIPESVTDVQDYAFYNAGFDGTLTLNNVTRIGTYAFGLKAEPAAGKSLKGNLDLSKVTYLGPSAFEHGANFAGTLTLNPDLDYLSERVFYNCFRLKGNMNLPQGLTWIGASCFYKCQNLTGELKIPAGLTQINDEVFYDCRKLTGELNIPEGITSIGNGAFNNTKFTKLSLPEGLESIGFWAFRSCNLFTGELKLPSTLKRVGYEAFRYNGGFSGVLVLPELEEVGIMAFAANYKYDWVDATKVKASAFGGRAETRGTDGVFAGYSPPCIIYLPAGVNIAVDDASNPTANENFVVGDRCDNFVVYDLYGGGKYKTNADYPIQYPFTATKARYFHRAGQDATNRRDGYNVYTDKDVYTHYLPYPTDIPEGMKAYEMNRTVYADKHIIFTRVEGQLKANTPYLLRLKDDATGAYYPQMSEVAVPVSVKDVYNRPDLTQPDAALGWQFLGTSMLQDNATAASKRAYIMGAAKTWKPVLTSSPGGYIHAHRAFVTAPEDYTGAPVAFLIDDRTSSELTGIEAIGQDLDTKQADIYSLDGRKLGRDINALPTGVYVVGGQKVYKF